MALKPVPQPPYSYPKAVWNINSNSPRYSNLKPVPRCGPPRGIRSPGVAPPWGSDPLMWPLPRDHWDEHLCEVNPTVWPPTAGSNPKVWPPPGGSDPTLWPPPRGIKFSAVAPAVRLTATPWIVRIFFQSLLLLLKGQSMKNVCMA
jgi:hypothetical protein